MKWVSFFLLCSLSITGCAQQQIAGLQRVDAFFQVRIPGTIPVQLNKPRKHHADTVYIIYMQVQLNPPAWKKAWNVHHSFRIDLKDVNEPAVNIGIEKATGKEIEVKREEGQRLVQLTLRKDQISDEPETPVKDGELLLKGEANGKTVYYTVKRLTELQSPLYQ